MKKLTPDDAQRKLANYQEMVTRWGGIPNLDERNIITIGLDRILADPELREVHSSAAEIKESIAYGNARKSPNIEPLVRAPVVIAHSSAPSQVGIVYGPTYTGTKNLLRSSDPPFSVGNLVRVLEAEYATSSPAHFSRFGYDRPVSLFARNGPIKVFVDNTEGKLEPGWSGLVEITKQSTQNPWTYNARPLLEDLSD